MDDKVIMTQGVRHLLRTQGANATFLVLIAASLSLYLELFIPPVIPTLALGDQAIYLLNATRLLDGQVMYRDVFHFTPPATELIYVILFKWFGVKAWIPQATLVLIGVSLTWFSVVISRRFMKGLSVFLPGFLFLTLAFGNALDATHHWFSSLTVIAALAVTIERRSIRRLAAAGVLCGLAACFTPPEGFAAILAIGLFLLWERWRQEQTLTSLSKAEAVLAGTFLGTIVALNAYFVWKVGLERFLFSTVIFVVRFYPSDWANTWRVYMADLPSLHSWFALPRWGAFLFIGILPLVYLIFLARYRRVSAIQPREPWDRLLLVNLVGIFTFLGVAPAPSSLRLCSVSLPALIILVWFVNQAGRLEQFMLRALWLIALVLAFAEPATLQLHWRAYLDLPTGRTAFLNRDLFNEYLWVFQRTQPSDYFFGDQLICFALKLRNPSEINFITPTDYTRPEQVRGLVDALERHQVRYMRWYIELDVPPPGPTTHDNLEPLRSYLRDHYHVAKIFPNHDLIWERNE